MKKKITDNLGLKILAVLCAVVLWFIVISLNDPVQYNKFSNIPVKIVNSEAVTGQGKVFEILDGTDLIDVTVYAKRSIIESIGRDDIVAVADMSQLTFMNTVAIEIYSNKNNDKLNSIKSNIQNLKVEIEDMKRVQMVVEATTTGEPAEGYMIGEVRTDQNLVQLSGPESVISQIQKVAVEVNVAGITTDIKTEVSLKLYDADGKEIINSSIAESITKLNVSVTIYQTKTVPVNYSYTGVPATGYFATGVIESSPENVVLAGKPSVLKSIAAVEVPSEALDITGLNANLATVVNLKQYLPDNVYFADNSFNGKSAVTVFVEKEVEATMNVRKSDITMQNLPENMEGSIAADLDTIPFQIKGLTQYVTAASTYTPRGTIDISSLKPDGEGDTEKTIKAGSYQAEVILSLPENITIKQPLIVTVELKEKADKTDETQEAVD